jgi:hypothetical protein
MPKAIDQAVTYKRPGHPIIIPEEASITACSNFNRVCLAPREAPRGFQCVLCEWLENKDLVRHRLEEEAGISAAISELGGRSDPTECKLPLTPIHATPLRALQLSKCLETRRNTDAFPCGTVPQHMSNDTGEWVMWFTCRRVG